MKSVLRVLKRIWILNAVRRFWDATKYFNGKYLQIIKWVFTSKEDTNFTFLITETNKLYIANAIAIATGTALETIIGYMKEAEEDKALAAQILETERSSPLRKFSDNKVLFGRRLGWYAAVRAIKPTVVVETGVDKGLGSMLLASAVLRNKEEGHEGKYYGTDINPEAGYLLSGKYKEVGEILYGDSIESLSKMTKPIELFINDSDHSDSYEYDEYITIKPLINGKTIILGDNAHCTDKLAKFSKEEHRKFIFIQEEPKDHWYPGAGIGISYT